MIRSIFRKILRKSLKDLSKLAIKKHNIRIIAVSGWYGTWIMKEALYLALKDDYQIRRNTESVHWDFSIPLTILGYKDVNYSIRGWLEILSSTIWVLLFEKANPHILILELDANKEEILKYWMEIITPEVLILGNTRPNMENAENLLVEDLIDDGTLICSENQKERFEKLGLLDGDYTVFTHEEIGKQDYKLEASLPQMMHSFLLLSIPVAEELGVERKTILSKLSNFEIPVSKLMKVKELLNGRK